MIEQVVIAICGAATVFLSQDLRESRRRWACLFGLVAQPFWFYSSFQAAQWGIFGLTVLYSIGWMRGFYNHWVREDRYGVGLDTVVSVHGSGVSGDVVGSHQRNELVNNDE